jgi:hypothetical protein
MKSSISMQIFLSSSVKNLKLLFFIFLLLTISCTPDKKSEIDTIQGFWQLHRATRNNKMTQSMDGMYLEFNGANSFDSNMLGDTTSFSSHIENRKLKVDHSLVRLFEIAELTDTMMKLNIEINEDKLSLVFKR